MKILGTKRLTAAIAAAMVLATALPAHAWTPTLSLSQVRISGCSFNYKAGTTGETGVVPYIRVGGNPWAPANTSLDNGARQNFAVLAQDGVGRWNGVTQNSPNYRIGMTYSTSTTNADIRFYQGMPAGQKAFSGYTYIQRVGDSDAGVNRCLEQAPNSSFQPSDIRKVNIYNAVRNDWFTQYGNDQWGRDVRKEWEKCSDTQETPDPRLQGENGTCSKKLDFGSVITHELGHAIGMVHPNPFSNNNDSPASAARCGYVKEQATMCRIVYNGRTAQRTPEIPDHDAYAWGQTYK